MNSLEIWRLCRYGYEENKSNHKIDDAKRDQIFERVSSIDENFYAASP